MDYPILDNSLTFSDYIHRSRLMIEERRTDLKRFNHSSQLIVDANSPFELSPKASQSKYGALLIHGLFDCPFSLRDLATQLQANDVLCRAILLPGHGTTPPDLLQVSYHDWIRTVNYGVESLKQQVDKIFLVGYSTGAALSVYHALKDPSIAGIVLLAPAIKIKAPVDTLFNLRYLIRWLSNSKQWVYHEDEVDYTKYLSIAFNPVAQVNSLTETVSHLHRQQPLDCPVFMVVSREDETISSHTAIDFFSSLPNPQNQLLVYTSCDHRYPDARSESRLAFYPDLNIRHFSHVSLPFAPDNSHYGQAGDYPYASRIDNKEFIYGAYNRIEENPYDLLYKMKLIKQRRRQLTYNPDFGYMADKIVAFIKNGRA